MIAVCKFPRSDVPHFQEMLLTPLMRRSGALMLLALGTAGVSGTAIGKPPLPVPCLSGNCANSPQSKTFLSYGQAGESTTGNTMTVSQTSANAILNWASFNIASGYNVKVVQPSATAQLLNNIWSADPSVIAGALSANGQIYLYNQNGIIFNKGAQIDVGSLTASTLNFSPVGGQSDPDRLFEVGILSNSTGAGGPGGAPIFQAAAGPGGTPYAGAITVNPGATLTAESGGRIMLLGAAVTNAGSISTPNGQTVLGAGNQVYLAASSDASLRGLLIEVNASGLGATVTDPDTLQTTAVGTVSNVASGTIRADTGNITLAGLVVNQAGRLTATTSVSENGSIYLVAGDTSAASPVGGALPFYSVTETGFGTLLPNNGGTVTLASGSVTEVLPSTADNSADKATISEANLTSGSFIPSQIDLIGQSVALKGNALVHAPGGNVVINAAADPSAQFTVPTAVVADGGMIYLDSGSTIDVSGESNVPVAASRNVLSITLETNDLQNDPLLRSGFLHGQAVTINANQGSTLFNDAPYVGNIGIGIDEVLTAAGNISLASDGAVITRAGSNLNVSGGSVAFQGGFAAGTTELQAANGKVYNIATAPNNVQYVSLANTYSYTDPTWGATTSDHPLTYYPGYLQGNSAGSIAIQGPQIYLAGSLAAGTSAGAFQRTANGAAPTSPLSSATLVPAGGAFSIGCSTCVVGNDRDFHAPAVSFVDGLTDTLGTSFDYLDPNVTLPSTLDVSPARLSMGGFSRISIYSNGAVTLPAGSSIDLPASGALTINTDASIAIAGDIQGPGAHVDIETKPIVAGNDSVSHDVDLGAGAVIDVSGAWVNDSPLLNAVPATAPIATTGGSITVSASGNLSVGADSEMNVSGGGWVNRAGALTAGKAGAIALLSSFQPDKQTLPYEGALSFGPGVRLDGNSLLTGGGGELSLASASVTVGTAPLRTPGELLLDPNFFSNKGFANYSIVGEDSLAVGGRLQNGTVLVAPVQETWTFTGDALNQPTGARVADFTQLTLLPTWQRSPASISFATTATLSGPGAADSGNLVLGANAAIVADPGASVTLSAGGDSASIDVLGKIFAPAGNISVQLEGPSYTANPSGAGYIADQQIYVGPGALLDASGYSEVTTFNALGTRVGNVLPGGTISLQAYKGFVVTDPTSTLNVSGIADTVDIVAPSGYVPTAVAAAAGSILIDAREGLVLQGTLEGQAAHVAGAAGGLLSIGLDLSNYTASEVADHSLTVGTPLPLTPRVLTLSSESPTELYGKSTSVAAGYANEPTLNSGEALISTQTLSAGGFDNIALKSTDIIALQGAIALAPKASLILDAPLLQGAPGSTALLRSAYVGLGNFYNDTDYFLNGNPTAAIVTAPGCTVAGPCGATLSVNAQLIDIRGRSGFAGFTNENLTSSGDIRLTSAANYYGLSGAPDFSGALNTAGALTLAAEQIYPTTYTAFTLASGKSVTIAPATGSSVTPLSAGGSLTIDAPSIVQEGVLRAPMGQITLQGIDTVASTGTTVPGSVTLSPGSLTSVSANGTVIPYGSTVNGQQWTYSPSSSVTEVVTLPPAKTISLSGANVAIGGATSSVGTAAVDLSGGGDLLAFEFIAGPGGSQDVLNPVAGVYQYAIVPSLGSKFAPIDAQYQWQQGTLASNFVSTPNTTAQGIYLSGVPGLTAGYYALLPARYALLPGAFAVDIVKTDSDLPAGPAVQQPNGSYFVAGRLAVAGTDIVASRTSTIVVAPNSVVNTESQFADSLANTFFNSAATVSNTARPALPADAGELELAATTSLALNGKIEFAAGSFTSGTTAAGAPITQQGAGGVVSIQAPSIQIVDPDTPATTGLGGALQLNAQSLDNLGAQSLILGAVAQNTAAGEQLNVAVTQSIEASNSKVVLTAPEIILAAQNMLSIDDNAQIVASGTLNQAPTAFVLNGAGALLSSSTSAVLPVITTLAGEAAPPVGTLSVGHQGRVAAVQAGGDAPVGSLLLYSTGNTTAQSDSTLSALALGLYSSHVSLGDVPTGSAAPGGLSLTAQLLTTLKTATELTIGSSSSLDFYGPVSIGAAGATSLHSLTLNTPAINGFDAAMADNVTLTAGVVTLENTNGVTAEAMGTGSGLLAVNAVQTKTDSGQITLGAGAKNIGGFGSVELNAGGLIEGQGTGASLSVANSTGAAAPNLGLTAAAVTAASGSDQNVVDAGTVTVAQAAGKAAIPTAPLGGSLTIDAAAIVQNGTLLLPSGVIGLHASAGNVALGATSVTNAAGTGKNFTVTDLAVAAGSIALASDHGDVSLAPGAIVDVSGVAAAGSSPGGNAGSLSISAPEGTFGFAGATLRGAAPATQLPGSFALDESFGLSAGGLGVLTDALHAGGFTGAVSLRTRSDGAVAVANTAANPAGITAESFSLTADGGSIDITGTIDTSGGGPLNGGGGAISLWAHGNLTLDPGAKLLADAGATGPVGINGSQLAEQGGNVTLGSAAGELILDGGKISMLGNGGAATDGTLTLRVPRTSDQLGVDIQIPAPGTTVEVDSHKPIVVEGVQSYAASVLGDPSLGSLDITQSGNPGTPYGDALIFVGNGNGAALATALLPGFSNSLGLNSPVQIQVRPGIEVDAPLSNGNSGDLVVGDANTTVWDLDEWNQGLGVPVSVTLRAAGNLIFDASLSDGFAEGGRVGVAGWTFGGGGAAGDLTVYEVTSSYRLAAGADLTSANPLAVVVQTIASPGAAAAAAISGGYLIAPRTGNVVVTPGTLIRTGDGNIDIAAGGDVLLGLNASNNPGASLPSYTYDAFGNLSIPAATAPLTSAIYTAGLQSVLTPAQALLFQAASGGIRSGLAASYGYDGGNLTVSAGADVQSAPSSEVPSDWLFRRGAMQVDPVTGATLIKDPSFNTAWGIEFANFTQGFGVLGGGNLALNATGNIVNASAVVPTTGRLLGAAGSVPSNGNLIVDGGGTLTVSAGVDIASGVFEDDWGNASINAGGRLTTGTTLANELTAAGQSAVFIGAQDQAVYPSLFVGNGAFGVNARAGATINFVANSTALPPSAANTPGNTAYFYTYASGDSLTVSSAGGDIDLLNTDSNLPLNSGNPAYIATQSSDPIAYPASVTLAAPSGNINIENSGLNLFPSATGNLKILANGFITNTASEPASFDLTNVITLTVNETLASLWPNPSLPVVGAVAPGAADSTITEQQALPAEPLHQNDPQPIDVVALTGGISPSAMTFPKAANVIAGGSIYDLTYAGKNLNPQDVTLIEAGGDIGYSTPTVPITNALQQNPAGITLAGPGNLVVLAGNSIDLGDSNGIETTGSLNDFRLASTGAGVVVGAGFGNNADGSLRQPSYQNFIDTYLAPGKTGTASAYSSDLSAYLDGLDPSLYSNLSAAAALKDFEGLTVAQELPLIAQVFSDELSATGLAHTLQGTSYQRGYDAINALFPATDAAGRALAYNGNLDMFFSQIKTEEGGDINLLVPGGSVVVGVPNPPASLAAVKVNGLIPAAANLGVLVLGTGAIQGFANEDFDVNTSRMLTLEGGNIILWATNGNIDAGKGAKSVSAAPPPVVQFNSITNTFSLNASNDVVGSGIGQLLSGPDETPGLVNLIAPKGAVNAGDAGIRVAGNLNIAAVQVIGAANISVVGTSTGVPVSEAGAFAGALSGANALGDASKAAVDQLSENLGAAATYQNLTDALTPTFITVKMFCLGIECETK